MGRNTFVGLMNKLCVYARPRVCVFSTSVVDNSTGIHKLIDMRVHDLLSKCSNKASVYFACM